MQFNSISIIHPMIYIIPILEKYCLLVIIMIVKKLLKSNIIYNARLLISFVNTYLRYSFDYFNY